MRNLIGLVLVIATTLTANLAFGSFGPDAASQALLQRANKTSPLEGIGTVISQSKNLVHAVYDFAVLGGVAGTAGINLVDEQGNAIALPKGAYVTNATYNIITAPVSAGDTSVSFFLLAAGDLLAASDLKTASGRTWIGPVTAGVPVGTAATWLGPTTSVNGSSVALVLVGSNLTAGKINLFLEYVIQ